MTRYIRCAAHKRSDTDNSCVTDRITLYRAEEIGIPTAAPPHSRVKRTAGAANLQRVKLHTSNYFGSWVRQGPSVKRTTSNSGKKDCVCVASSLQLYYKSTSYYHGDA